MDVSGHFCALFERLMQRATCVRLVLHVFVGSVCSLFVTCRRSLARCNHLLCLHKRLTRLCVSRRQLSELLHERCNWQLQRCKLCIFYLATGNIEALRRIQLDESHFIQPNWRVVFKHDRNKLPYLYAYYHTELLWRNDVSCIMPGRVHKHAWLHGNQVGSKHECSRVLLPQRRCRLLMVHAPIQFLSVPVHR
jgi:hypothetical protein